MWQFDYNTQRDRGDASNATTKKSWDNATESTAASSADASKPAEKPDSKDLEVRHAKRPKLLPHYNFTKFCYRHNPENKTLPTKTLCYSQDLQRMTKIQQRMADLDSQDREDVDGILKRFTSSNDKMRKLILDGLLALSCFPQLSYVMSQVSSMIKIDFISSLPQELSLKILSYLDCQSLCSAAMACKRWQALADDDKVWYHMCVQHIDRKCPNCGWGLPLLHMKRARFSESTNTFTTMVTKNKTHDTIKSIACKTKPWKEVYAERYRVEYNWRRGIYTVHDFNGHMDGVLALQFNHRLLFTGSYDSTVAIWDLYSGKLLRRLSSSNDGIKALHFDDRKLITGSLDKTIRVWNYATGECISTYRGHTDSVMSVDSFKKIIVSGSADKTVKVWHVESRACYTLRGHTEWVNCVKLHPKSFSCFSCSDDTTIRMWDIRSNACLKIFRGHVGQVQKVIPLTIIDVKNLATDEIKEDSRPEQSTSNSEEQLASLDPNLPYPTHLLSCSLDNTIKLWDVATGKCIRTHFGHVEGVWDIAADNFRIVSGSHDGTLKLWDLQCGKCMHTFQNKPQDHTNTASNSNETTTTNATNHHHTQSNATTTSQAPPPIACVAIGDSELFCGDEKGCVRRYRFD